MIDVEIDGHKYVPAERAANDIPTMDAVNRFMRSNPLSSWEMLTEILDIGAEESAAISGGKFRELWKLAGGSVNKKGHAWVEVDRLPKTLRQIIDAVARCSVPQRVSKP